MTPPNEVTDRAIFHNNKGLCYQKLKENILAINEFSKAVDIKPDYIKPRGFRMNMLKTEEWYDKALEDAKKIKELDHNYWGIQ